MKNRSKEFNSHTKTQLNDCQYYKLETQRPFFLKKEKKSQKENGGPAPRSKSVKNCNLRVK
jgi:hypothetical protein